MNTTVGNLNDIFCQILPVETGLLAHYCLRRLLEFSMLGKIMVDIVASVKTLN